MSAAASRQFISFGPFEFDAASGLLFRGEHETLLPPRASEVLHCLLQQPGKLVTKEVLLESVWKDAFVGEHSLTRAICVAGTVMSGHTCTFFVLFKWNHLDGLLGHFGHPVRHFRLRPLHHVT